MSKEDQTLVEKAAKQFPRSARYDLDWVEANSLGENVLHFAESLTEVLHLKAGMRVLDLGCGHAVSSIFLAKEFGVQVWAVDRGVDPTENHARIAKHNCADRVFPLRADARNLPLPRGYFDAVISLDAYLYFGTDDRFLPILAPYIKPGGHLGIVDAYSAQEFDSPQSVPESARAQWQQDGWYLVHSIPWWRQHWAKTGLLEVLVAEPVPGSELITARYVERYRDDPEEADFIRFMETDYGRQLGTFRLLARRTQLEPELEEGDVPY